LALDPGSVGAKSLLATALADRVNTGTTVSAAVDIARAEGLIGQVLAASPRDPLAHFAKGVVLRVRGRPEEAIPEFETVLASNRNETRALFHLGWCKLMTGSIEEVVPLAEQVIRLSPRDPYIANRYSRLGLVHLLQSRTDDAVLWFERARSANPALPSVHANLASAFALKCSSERAAAELAEARRLSVDGRYSSVTRLKAVGYFGVPKVRALFEGTFFAGLRLAGMPEE
jgi:Flp pilus assembly protein TadD